MRKIYFFGFMFVLGVILVGCGTANDNGVDANDEATEDNEEMLDNENALVNDDDADMSNESDEEGSDIEVEEGDTESQERVIEGMDDEVDVVNYQISPYDLAYQLDESLGAPEVKGEQVVHSDGDYKVTLEVMMDAALDDIVSDLQDKYQSEDPDFEGELEDVQLEANDNDGKAQIFEISDVTQGFYAYDMNDARVLVITYEYPVEGGDGMGPLLEAMQDTLMIP